METKRNPNGFNLYRNDKFWMVITLGSDEQKAIKDITNYIRINNFNPTEFTYKQFENHNSDRFELKKIN
jgi:hypothetical protein